jgi:hypothetical protein
MTTSELAAASAALAAAVAPDATSGSAFAPVRFQTVSLLPASSSRLAMRLPIPPSPTTATLVTLRSSPIG